MNEFLFYAGLVLAIIFFIASIVLFFRKRIVEVIKYYLKMKDKKPLTTSSDANITIDVEKQFTDSGESTEILNTSDDTEILDEQDSNKVTIDSEGTTLL